MVVYWDLAAAWNFLLDYLLLLCCVRLAGLPPRRKRLAAAAAFGALYAVLFLALDLPLWTLPLSLLLMCRLAFGASAQGPRLTVLFLLLSCALGGGVLLLGRLRGTEHLRQSLLSGRIPWGLFLLTALGGYLLSGVILRGSAKHHGDELVRVRIERGTASVTLTLLRDSGNTLTDPLTGASVPVIHREAVAELLPGAELSALDYCAVGVPAGTLEAFRSDHLYINNLDLGQRLIALAPEPLNGGAGYQGLWNDKEAEHGLETALG